MRSRRWRDFQFEQFFTNFKFATKLKAKAQLPKNAVSVSA
jgi:hypothetical protein